MSMLVESDRDRQKILNGKQQAFLRYWPHRDQGRIVNGTEHNLHDAAKAPPFCRVKVAEVFPILLRNITEKEAAALGYNTVAEFKHVWRSRHGTNKTMMDGNTTFFMVLFRVIERY